MWLTLEPLSILVIHEDGFDSYIPYEQTVYQASKPGRLSR